MRRAISVLPVLVLVLAVGATMPCCNRIQAPATGHQWEYRVVKHIGGEEEHQTEFNRLGADGWECCGLESGGKNVFKRLKR